MSTLRMEYAEVSRLIREEQQRLQEEEDEIASIEENEWRTDLCGERVKVVMVDGKETYIFGELHEKLLTVDDLLQIWTAASDEGGSDSAEDIDSDSPESQGDLQPGHTYLDRPRRPY